MITPQGTSLLSFLIFFFSFLSCLLSVFRNYPLKTPPNNSKKHLKNFLWTSSWVLTWHQISQTLFPCCLLTYNSKNLTLTCSWTIILSLQYSTFLKPKKYLPMSCNHIIPTFSGYWTLKSYHSKFDFIPRPSTRLTTILSLAFVFQKLQIPLFCSEPISQQLLFSLFKTHHF